MPWKVSREGDDIAFYLGICLAYFFCGKPCQVYLLASDILDYSLNVRQIDRRLRNIIYLTKRVLLYYFYIISRVRRTVITNLCELRAISTKVVVLGTPIRH